MNPRGQTVRELQNDGYVLIRHGRNHDIFYNAKKQITIPVKRHDFDEDDMRYILKEAKIGKKKKS